jgi:hypothetical protein
MATEHRTVPQGERGQFEQCVLGSAPVGRDMRSSWLTARKMVRHLSVAPPPRVPIALIQRETAGGSH